MENNIVNLEEEYFKKKNQEAYQTLMNRDFNKVTELLKEPLDKIENSVKGNVYCPQNIFEAGIFLNFLDKKVEQENFAKINYYDFYLMSAAANYNLDLLDESRKNYVKAIAFNPASSIARLQVLEIDKRQKNFENYLEDVREFFNYAYRRTDIAKAYRDVGYYLYEMKDYEMSLVAYYLSNIYEFTDVAIDEIKHIAEAEKIDLDSKAWLSEEMMGEFHNKYKIPLLPSEKLTSLAIAMANDAEDKKAFPVARFAYQVAYELTLEEEYLKKVEEFKKVK